MEFTCDLRLLDGAHRWRAYISTGKLTVKVLVQELKGMDQKTIHYHLGKMPVLANSLNADLSQGFTVSQVAQKHGWTEPMVWSLALEEKDDLKKFKELGWIKRPSSSLAIAMTALTGRGRLQRTD